MEIIKKEKLTIIIDASSLKNSACLRRQFFDVVQGYREAGLNNDTHFGSAFHKFRAHYRTTGDFERATLLAKRLYEIDGVTVKPKKTFLTSGFLISICDQYAEKYKNDDFQKYKNLIEPESRFMFPYHTCDEFDILVAGTMDELGQFRITKHFGICDVKVSGMWDLKRFLTSYKLNPQLILYRWAVRQYAKHYPDSVWAEIDRGIVAAFIDGVFYKAGTASSDGPTVTFMRKDEWNGDGYILFKDEQIETFGRMLDEHIGRFIVAIKQWIKTGKIPEPYGLLTDSCDGKFGPCKYAKVCTAPDKIAMDARLAEFEQRHYNPMNFGDQEI
jgi:hypothetical protein